jgi:diaminopimelate decarboxylase
MEMLSALAKEKGVRQDIFLRLTPGVDPHTHRFISTGITDSKFGFPLISAEDAIAKAMKTPSLNLVGLHFHLGSQIFEVEPYVEAIGVILDLSAKMKQKMGFNLKKLDIGGGVGVQYTLDNPVPPVAHFAEKIVAKFTGKCKELKLAPPQLVIEPGRALVCQAGVALYTVGVVKDIPGVRCYISVDGGMGDNIRPAIYGSKYEALLANRATAKEEKQVTIAGKFCESGDILIRDIMMPEMKAGDILAIPDAGAYCLAMASNYNASLRPAVVLVQNGKPYLIRRRETLEDLVRNDVV